MRKVRSTGTPAELILRRALHARGFRYRVNVASTPGKPDIASASRKVAVFIDGDYWHGNQWRRRGFRSLDEQFRASAKADYWVAKIYRNIARDTQTTARLLSDGYTVLRVWESEVIRNPASTLELCVEAITGEAAPTQASLLPQRTVLEFFAGLGLMGMGLERQGWSVALANDIDPLKARMFRDHFGDERPLVVADVASLTGGDLPTATLATASFPCTDVSLAGAREGLRGKESSAFFAFAELLREMGPRRPPLVLLENVPGLLTSHKGSDFREVISTLNDLGYAADALIMDALRFVPQSRQRLFIIGAQRDLGLEPSGGQRGLEAALRPKALAEAIRQNADLDWELRDLPDPPELQASLSDLLEDLSGEAAEWWSEARRNYLLAQMSERHRTLAEQLIQQPQWSYGTMFRRIRQGRSMAELRADGVAGCLRTPKGGSGRQILFKAGFGEYHVRLLTPRECARLMGADDYVIRATANQALFGFGDAVCVPVVEWLAKYYLNPLVSELMRGKVLRCHRTPKNGEARPPAYSPGVG